jgi:hypothetical protein
MGEVSVKPINPKPAKDQAWVPVLKSLKEEK